MKLPLALILYAAHLGIGASTPSECSPLPKPPELPAEYDGDFRITVEHGRIWCAHESDRWRVRWLADWKENCELRDRLKGNR